MGRANTGWSDTLTAHATAPGVPCAAPGYRRDESESVPQHVGPWPGYLVGVREVLQGGRWNAGDAIIHHHSCYGSTHRRTAPSSSGYPAGTCR